MVFDVCKLGKYFAEMEINRGFLNEFFRNFTRIESNLKEFKSIILYYTNLPVDDGLDC